MSESNKVLWNQPQDLSDPEQTQARENINAAKNATATQSSNGLMSSADKTKLDGIEAGAEVNVQSDWNQTNSSADDYIKNKPENLVQDANYVHTDNNFTDSDKSKLDGIEAGAEVNVQSDWNQTDNTKDDYIKNKPNNLVQDASYVHTDNNFTNADKNKLDGIAAGAEVNVQSDWNQTDNTKDDYIKNKPSNLVQDASYVHTDNNFTNSDKNKLDGIAAGAEVNVQSDWNQTNSSADDYIKNKPSNLVQDASYVHTDNNFTNSDKSKLDGIAAGAEVNVQSDWNQTDNTKDDYIKNKPNIPAAQVQSDWTATSGMGKILNKPEIGYKAYGASSVTEATSLVVDGDEPNGVTDVKVNGGSKGILISGPYKTLLDSGIAGALGDADHGIFIGPNGVFQACTNPVFFKVTLSTTFAELQAAVTANKIPILVTASKVIPMSRYSANTYAMFTDVSIFGSLLEVAAHTYYLGANGWYEYPKRMNNNEDIHLPSVITTKVNVHPQDATDTWLRIGGIVIGGKGTNGGNIQIEIKGVTGDAGTLAYEYAYDTLFRTQATTGSLDNTCTYGFIQTNQNWQTLFVIDQYSGTSTVNCMLEINLYDTLSTNPSHYKIKIRKTFSGGYTQLYISATESCGSMD